MIKKMVQADLYRYGGLSGKRGFIKGWLIPGFRYTYLLRKVSNPDQFYLSRVFYQLLLKRYSLKYGFQIDPRARIGEGFYIGHFGMLVINPKAKIGKNCNVASGVTIGQTNRGKSKGCPTIGDGVWIGTNAVVVGNINVGSNVLIAPNSYVNMDVPENSLVIGNPAKIIYKKTACIGYINNVLVR